MNQRVVCAANKLSDGTIILGIRHWDQFMHSHLEDHVMSAPEEIDTELLEFELIRGHEQGFVDQFGKFLNRVDALKIAKENDQIIRDIGYEPDELLF